MELEKAYSKIKDFRKKLGENLLEKDEIIDIMCICFIAQEPLLMIGPPGTAKSMLADNFCRLLGLNNNYYGIQKLKSVLKNTGPHKEDIVNKLCSQDIAESLNKKYKITLTSAITKNLKNWQEESGDPDIKINRLFNILDEPKNGCQRRYFSYLLTEFTDPSEILGPIDIPKMLGQLINISATDTDNFEILQKELLEKIEQGYIATSKFERITHNMLPQAEVVFLDEIFRANSAILNALLTIINERKFYQPEGPVDSPLKILFAASNELPAESSLRAFIDRFPLRIYNKSVVHDKLAEPDILNALLTKGLSNNNLEKSDNKEYYAHFIYLQKYLSDHISEVVEKNSVRQAFIQCATSIDTDFRLNLSDRRLIKLFKLVCASALLNRFDESRIKHNRIVGESPLPLAMEDLKILKYTWNTDNTDQIEAIETEVEEFINNL